MKFINIRGCNGSGKTTLLRSLATDPLCQVQSIVMPAHDCRIPVTYIPNGLAIIGDYTRAAAGATTAGCDRIKTQQAAKDILEFVARDPQVDFILFEGVVVSTIYGPWRDWSRANGGMAWAFLDTPLEICLGRIQERNGGKPIKEDQVADKHRTIARVRDKAMFDGEAVCDLHWQTALRDIKALINFMRHPIDPEVRNHHKSVLPDSPWVTEYPAPLQKSSIQNTTCCDKPNISPRGVCISCGAPQ